MGARQSKRSVDITTATGAASESGGDVVAGKLGKLEDGAVAGEPAATKQNGDAVLKEKERQLESGTPENEKDSSTEKGLLVPPAASDSATTPAAVENGLGDATPDEMPTEKIGTSSEEPQSPTSPSEDTSEVASPTSPTSPTSGDEKQTEKKKEKKKKWSFRSISFSKKDKQKPSKKQQQQEENGDIEKVPEEGADENAAAAAPAGDVLAAASPKEEITKDETSAPQSEVIKSEEAPAPKVTESTAEKTNEAVKTPVEDKCEKPVAPIACEAACEKPATCESKEVKDPVPAEPVQTLEAAPAAEPVEHVTSAAENKVEEPAKTDVVAEVPVPENVEAKQEPESLPPPPVEEQKEEKSSDMAEVSATESTLSDMSITKDITEKIAGMMLDDVPPVDIPVPTESTVAIAEN